MAAASIPTLRQCNFLTLSFSGAGHLLPYHLGVAVAIKSNECSMGTPIHAVSGSSSGAIAATLFVYFPHERIKDYADRFIADGGRAMHHFKELIVEANNSAEARYRNQQSTSLANTRCSAERFVPHSGQAMSHLRAMIDDANASGEGLNPHSTTLHIATTRCSDASLRLFDFPPNLSSIPDESLVKCLEARHAKYHRIFTRSMFFRVNGHRPIRRKMALGLTGSPMWMVGYQRQLLLHPLTRLKARAGSLYHQYLAVCTAAAQSESAQLITRGNFHWI